MAVTVSYNLCISLAPCGTPQAGLCQTGSEPAGLLWARLCHPVSAGKHSGQELLSLGERPMGPALQHLHLWPHISLVIM